MSKRMVIKVCGIAATVVGALSTLLYDWSSEKETELIIDEKIDERFRSPDTEVDEEEES